MNLATIGTGWITADFIKAAQQTEKLTLQAVYSRSAEKAKQFAHTYGAPHFYDDLDQMAKNEQIDAVYIASPNSLHYEQAILFLKHKKHVICEKPIFSNTDELKEAYKVAEENGVYLFEAIRNIHSPNFNRLQKELARIGKVRSALLHYVQYSSRYDRFLAGEEPNVFSPRFSGGALVDLGVYPVYLAAALFGEPQRICYHPVILRSGIDGNGTLILDYGDFICTVACSKISQSFIPCEIHGEAGTIVLDKAAPISKMEFIDHRSKESESFGTVQHENDMVYEIENIVSIIETRNDEQYEKLKHLSQIVLSITETARKQSGILFEVEK